jgi:hypothetical protein
MIHLTGFAMVALMHAMKFFEPAPEIVLRREVLYRYGGFPNQDLEPDFDLVRDPLVGITDDRLSCGHRPKQCLISLLTKVVVDAMELSQQADDAFRCSHGKVPFRFRPFDSLA